MSYNKNNKCISENKISLKGEPNTKGTILLQTIDKPILSIILKVTMVDCPPGYAYDNNSHICNCEPDMFYGINCNNSREYHSYIEQDTWIGFIREKTSKQVFVSGKCYWFCNWKTSGKKNTKRGSIKLFNSQRDEEVFSVVNVGRAIQHIITVQNLNAKVTESVFMDGCTWD